MYTYTIEYLLKLEASPPDYAAHVRACAMEIQQKVADGDTLEPGAREVLDRLLAADATPFVPTGPLGGSTIRG